MNTNENETEMPVVGQQATVAVSCMPCVVKKIDEIGNAVVQVRSARINCTWDAFCEGFLEVFEYDESDHINKLLEQASTEESEDTDN